MALRITTYLLAVCLVLFVGHVTAKSAKNEELLDSDEQDAIMLTNILNKPRIPQAFKDYAKNGFVGDIEESFSFTDCGAASATVHVQSLSLRPDPLRIPGNITASFQMLVKSDVYGMVSMDIWLQKKIAFIWVNVPCSDIKTCHYADMCSEIAKLPCPAAFKQQGIPCQCPLKKGLYKLTPSVFSIGGGRVPSGDYKLTLTFKQGSTQLSCVHLEFAIA